MTTADFSASRNEPLAQTFVRYKSGDVPPIWFMVSTINRPSSAVASYEYIYAETLVWEWFPAVGGNGGERGRLIGVDEAGRDLLYAHNRMVDRLFATGKCDAE